MAEPVAPVRVLVVDDDFMVARVHRDVVQRIPGFDVVGEARTGADALELVAGLRPDIVLLDVYLPDIPGTEVLQRFRSGAAPVRVIDFSCLSFDPVYRKTGALRLASTTVA